jgi:3-deoxy-manno-octulosonate cytidylyltransferase (CMP-KDO synthetase)
MVVAVIPSRFHSARFPGKALVPVGGVPLVVRVADRALKWGGADRVIVATDDARIAAVVAQWCPRVEIWLSSRDEAFRTGSDRVASAVAQLEIELDPSDLILNVQGDEPLIEPMILDQAVTALAPTEVEIGTVAAPLLDRKDDRDAVKVQIDARGHAVAFSRGRLDGDVKLHLGLYSFTPASLRRFASLPTGELERAEDLEQLRAMEHGMTIGVRVVETAAIAVNRPGDIARVEGLL